MSNTQYVFIERSKIPDRDQLQAAIDSLAFPIQLDPEFTPFDDLGFSPCTLNGRSEVGFEIFYDATKEIVEDDEEFSAIAAGRDYCISLVWRSSHDDLICVMGVSAAYAHAFEAVISYEGDEPIPAATLIKQTRELLAGGDAVEEVEKNDAIDLKESPPTPVKLTVTVTGLIGGKIVTKKYERGDK
ncbi:hypothetical protein FN976_17585 [Caenimonas sedimenti]|uniref:Uncharacterized protein n=1 Tax=Caenimonas sedimenti TaxID=2596921 RepID=A0A562ZMW6_9BURK|nr:hypothetical protein [Caenimonas sedimenti]TWO69645.1 hypothetical protein FN976_17585 [Caenimonas sedimenti]